MTRVLVTGGHGSVGTALLKRLVDSEYDVVGVDHVSHAREVDLPVRMRDLRTDVSLPDADVIIHLAAHSQVQPMIDQPELATENVAMTQRVLDHAVSQDAGVIIASSREVYGSTIRPDETAVSTDVTNPYGASKIATEALASAYASCFNVDVATVRLSNVYGPHDLNRRVVPIFVSKGLSGDQLTVYGTSKILDFVYITDVVDVFEQMIDKLPMLAGETVTVGSGRGISLQELADQIVERIDGAPGYVIEPNRTGDTDRFVADIEKTKSLLEFDPTSLEEGLSQTVEWYRNHDSAREQILN